VRGGWISGFGFFFPESGFYGEKNGGQEKQTVASDGPGRDHLAKTEAATICLDAARIGDGQDHNEKGEETHSSPREIAQLPSDQNHGSEDQLDPGQPRGNRINPLVGQNLITRNGGGKLQRSFYFGVAAK
jgi:hypothetical protein